jgi:membrane protein implicated in regulation of membrane protease activity
MKDSLKALGAFVLIFEILGWGMLAIWPMIDAIRIGSSMWVVLWSIWSGFWVTFFLGMFSLMFVVFPWSFVSEVLKLTDKQQERALSLLLFFHALIPPAILLRPSPWAAFAQDIPRIL